MPKMGIRILSGVRINEGEDRTGACLYQSTSNMAFGPVFSDVETVEAFLEWFAAQGHPDSYLIEHAAEIYQREYLPELRAKG